MMDVWVAQLFQKHFLLNSVELAFHSLCPAWFMSVSLYIFCYVILKFKNDLTLPAKRGLFCQCLSCVVVLCGGSIPPPVLSYHNVMVLQFTSDSSITHRGFSASLTFIIHTGMSMVCMFNVCELHSESD